MTTRRPKAATLRIAALYALALLASTGCDGDAGESHGGADETWTDEATGLVWQVASDSGYVNWTQAMAHCDSLTLDGHDDWRLPTISELRSLIRGCPGTESGGACGVSDECLAIECQTEGCYQCVYGDGPSNGCFGPTELADPCEYFWSSSTVAATEPRAWAVGFPSAFVYKPRVYFAFHARCVRAP